MPSPSLQVSVIRMPEFNTEPCDPHPRLRSRRGGGSGVTQNHRGLRNHTSSSHQRSGAVLPTVKNVPPASAFMGRSQLGRQSAEEHLKQMTPELRKWVSELAPVLEMYDYDARDIADLVKQCQFDPAKIQTAVDAVFEEKRGHELGEWQVSRGKRRPSNSRKEDVPTSSPRENYRSHHHRGHHLNHKLQTSNQQQMPNRPTSTVRGSASIVNGSPCAQDGVGRSDSSLGHRTDHNRQKGRRSDGNHNPPTYTNQQRRRSVNNGGRRRPRASRLRGDSRDGVTSRKEDTCSAMKSTTEEPHLEPSESTCKVSPPSSWARVAAGALEKKKPVIITSTSTQQTGTVTSSGPVMLFSESVQTRISSTVRKSVVDAESDFLQTPTVENVGDTKDTSATPIHESVRIEEETEVVKGESNVKVEGYSNNEIREIDQHEASTTVSPPVRDQSASSSQFSPSQQSNELSELQSQQVPVTARSRSPSISPQPASIQDPTPSSPLPTHQPSPSIGGVHVSVESQLLTSEIGTTDDVVLPPPVGRDVVLPRNTATLWDHTGFVFGTLHRGAGIQRIVPDVRFGIQSSIEDSHLSSPQSSPSGPPGLAESPKGSIRGVPKVVEAQKIDVFPEDPAIVERKTSTVTKIRPENDPSSLTSVAQPLSSVQHHQQPTVRPEQHPQQQPQLVYENYPNHHHHQQLQQQHSSHHQQRLHQDFTGMDEQQPTHPRRHYNSNVVYHNNSLNQSGPGGLKSQRCNTNRMNHGHRNNSGNLTYHHHGNVQSHHQNFSHDDYLDRVPNQQYQQHFQRGMGNRGYTSFRQQEYNPIGFNCDVNTIQDASAPQSTNSATSIPPYGNTYSTTYSYGMNHGDAHQGHLHESTQSSNEYQSYHQHQQYRGYNQVNYRPYGQQFGFSHPQLELQQQQHKQLPQQHHYGQLANSRFGTSTDPANSSVESRQSQQQQPQQDDASTQQATSATTAATATHPSTSQQSQIWRQPNPANSSYTLYDPQTRQQTSFSSSTNYDYDQSQPQTYDHSSSSLRYGNHHSNQQQPLMQTAVTANHHQMVVMDSTNTGTNTAGSHRGYSATALNTSYTHHGAGHPSYLYDAGSSSAASTGVPVDYTATSALLQQHSAQTHLGGFAAASHQQRAATSLEQGYANSMYSNYGHQYPTQSARHL